LERELRVLVKVSAYRGELWGERLGLFEKIHGASGVWAGPARCLERTRTLVVGGKKPRLACPS